MKDQGLNARYKRLDAYLENTCGLQTEQYRFGDTHGQAKGSINEMRLFSPSETNKEDVINQAISETRISDEYVLHLIIKDFGGELKLLLARLIYWMTSEKQGQEPVIDYTLKWKNDQTIDLNIFLEIQEKTKIDAQQGVKTC